MSIATKVPKYEKWVLMYPMMETRLGLFHFIFLENERSVKSTFSYSLFGTVTIDGKKYVSLLIQNNANNDRIYY